MPTAARLVAALLLAALGWFVADLVKPLLPDGTRVGLFSPVSAAVGGVIGWAYAGRRLDRDEGGAVGVGLTSVFLLAFWVLVIFSGHRMVILSMQMRYDGPVEAIQGMFAIAMDYLRLVMVPEVIAALLVGGLVAGWITRAVARRWP